MLRRVAERPAGRLTEVFTTPSELQGAYDFVRGSVASQRLVDAFAQATLRACRDEWLYVVVDGSSLSLTDRAKTKDFGSIGKRAFPTRGIKVLTALAVEPNGATLGLVDQQYWARPRRSRLSRFFRRATKRTETQRWVETIERAAGRVRAAGVRPWLVIDREGDCGEIPRARLASPSSMCGSPPWSWTCRITPPARALHCVSMSSGLTSAHRPAAKTRSTGCW
jgi:hypothetical protein